jgi:hypothetical protein
MKFIQSEDRNQMLFGTLESAIAMDHVVRFIDAFVEKLDLDRLGFRVQVLQKEGRPAFESRVFMKLYLFARAAQ